MGSMGKSVFRIGAALMLLASIVMFAPTALANAKPPAPPAKPEQCVPMGGVKISGGSVTNTTNLDLTADGGTGISDATGGDDNVALTTGDSGEDQPAAAGNGGTADASARSSEAGATETKRQGSPG